MKNDCDCAQAPSLFGTEQRPDWLLGMLESRLTAPVVLSLSEKPP